MVTVINKKSPHYGKKGKFVEEIKEENITLVFFKEEEVLYQFKNDEIQVIDQGNKKLNIPQSRKDFYFIISKKETNRTQIINMIQALESKQLFNFKAKEHDQDQNGLSKQAFFDFVRDIQNSKNDVITKIREYRDQGLLEFLLPNNSYNPKDNLDNIQPKKKYNKKKRKTQNKKFVKNIA
jgi:hypothetical protein